MDEVYFYFQQPPVIRNASGRFVDGHIMCEFNMNRTIEIPETGEKFDLENDKLHLLLSRGVNSAKGIPFDVSSDRIIL